MKVHLKMLGCRLNQGEIDSMARQFLQQGHEIVDDASQAEQVIINTCAVTADAVKSGRKLIREAHRAAPNAQISVTGCYAQIAPHEIQTLAGVSRVVDNHAKERLVEQITGVPLEAFELEPLERTGNPRAALRTRAFIKVQDGCDNACTFCVTTVARGAGRSRPADEVVQEVRYLHEQMGYQEMVLTGVHLGSYGHDRGEVHGLIHLVQRLLAETAVPRLRLSSLEPWDLEADFFALWQDARLCPHLHLPLQSGCDATLKRMRRNTSQVAFAHLIAAARSAIPQVRITSDVIVGFPGETDAEFAESEAFIQAMDFAGLHVFRYSVRPMTPAAKMRGQVPEAIKKTRSQRLIEHASTQEQRYAEQFIGQTQPVLWENVAGATPEGFQNVGYTPHYVRVCAIYPRPLTSLITPTHLISAHNGIVQALPVIE